MTELADTSEAVPAVGENLKRLRTKRGLSLDRLAKLSGVSKAMLGQVEQGRSVPTVNTVWKIARALNVPFSALIELPQPLVRRSILRSDQAKLLSSTDGAFVSRALFPFDSPRAAEFYQLRFSVGAVENADAHSAGTRENLTVHQGRLEIVSDGKSDVLGPGDAIVFEADTPHVYRNLGEVEVIAYLVMTYAISPEGAA